MIEEQQPQADNPAFYVPRMMFFTKGKGVHNGYLSEHHPTGETAQKAGDYAEDMAMEMLATTLGLPNDPSLAWNEKEEQWKLSNKIYRTQNFTQSAEGHKDGLWNTVISAAVLIL